MEKTKKLIIIGTGEFAQIAYEYFTYDSNYEVAGFAVEEKYRDIDELYGIKVVDFEEIEKYFPKECYHIFVAITYVKLNRVRKRIYDECKRRGYTCASYVSSKAFVWRNVEIGENVFIFENNTIQHCVKIGSDTILWSGNHIGHRSTIGNHSWITSHVVVSGFCSIGSGCFIGVNATLGDNVAIGNDVVIGAGALTVKSLEGNGLVFIGCPAKKIERTSYEQFGV